MSRSGERRMAIAAALLVGLASIAACASSTPRRAATSRSLTSLTVPPRAVLVPALLQTVPKRVAIAEVTIHRTRYPFIIDTGAGSTVISAALSKKLGLASEGKGHQSAGLACENPSQPAAIDDWHLGPLNLGRRTIESEPFGPHGTVGAHPVVGLLGSDVLHDLGSLTLDFTLRTIAVGGPTASGGEVVPVKINRDSRGATDAVAAVTVNGHRTGFIVDTGAQLSQVDTRFAHRAGLQSVGRPINTQTVACIAKVTPVNLPTWRAGNVSLPVTAAFTSVELIATKSRGQLAGILGIDVLDRYSSVTLDYQHSRLVLRTQGGDNP